MGSPDVDFDDWIDDVNGFIHMINPLPIHMSTLTDAPPTTCFITDNTQDESQEPDEPKAEEEETPVNYDIVPRSDTDDKLQKVRPWLYTLQRPDNLTDTE